MFTAPWYVKSLLLPPTSRLLLALFGALVWRWRPRLGRVCVALGVILLYALSTSVVSSWLVTGVQLGPPLA